jgi:acyl-CoA synthetase (AMP-forming)/AMP-acid ligase II/acyl carrier protein
MSNNRTGVIPGESATLVEALRWRALHQSADTFIRFLADGENETSTLSFSELDREARRVAAKLQLALEKGDRALLCYAPGLEFLTAFLGCLYSGVIAVPIFPPTNERGIKRLESLVGDAGAKAVMTTSEIARATETQVKNLPELGKLRWISTDRLEKGTETDWMEFNPGDEDVAFLQYTSGSTGNPKGVIVTHRNITSNIRMIIQCMEVSPETKMVSWLPVYHDMGLIGCLLMPVYAGISVVLMPPVAFIEKPLRWLAAISKYRGTLVTAPNFAYELCVRKVKPEQVHQLDLSSIKVMGNGAEPIRSDTLDRFSTLFAKAGFRSSAFFPCYGLAEATLIVSGGPVSLEPSRLSLEKSELESLRVRESSMPTAKTLVSCGRVCEGQQVMIVNPENGEPCGQGGIGEIWVAGPNVANGYWNKPEPTKNHFAASLKQKGKGFLRTGDLGFIWNSELYVAGREKDLIIVMGRNHYPQDIELTVERAHQAIRPGNVVAFAAEGSQREELWVVCELERTAVESLPADLPNTILSAVAHEHELQIARIFFVKAGSLPKTTSGKLQRGLTKRKVSNGEIEVVSQWNQPERSYQPLIPSTHSAKSISTDGTAKPPTTPTLSQKPDASAIVKKPVQITKSTHKTVEKKVGDSPSAEKIREQLLRWFSKAAEIPMNSIDPAQPLVAYGMDSLMAFELGCVIEEQYRFKVPSSLPFDYPTLDGVVEYLSKRIASDDANKS